MVVPRLPRSQAARGDLHRVAGAAALVEEAEEGTLPPGGGPVVRRGPAQPSQVLHDVPRSGRGAQSGFCRTTTFRGAHERAPVALLLGRRSDNAHVLDGDTFFLNYFNVGAVDTFPCFFCISGKVLDGDTFLEKTQACCPLIHFGCKCLLLILMADVDTFFVHFSQGLFCMPR